MADTTLDELKLSNQRRLGELAAQGVAIQGLREGYQTHLLEFLVGDGLSEVQVAHELWVAAEIDKAFAQVARVKLLGGVPTHPRGL